MLSSLFPNQITLGFVQAGVAGLLALGVMLVASRRRIHVEKEVAIALVRAIVQITAVGSVLFVLLEAPVWTSAIVLLAMFVAAAITAAQRAEGIPGAFWPSFFGIALGSGIVIGLMTWAGVIEATVTSLVPVGSMVIANAMNTNALALNRFKAEILAHTGQIEAGLALGAEPYETVARHVEAAAYASLIPRIDSLRALGIVWIPGLMTGMVLSGTDPVYAAVYQFVVMAMIFATAGLTAIITLAFIRSRVFSPADQLLLRPGMNEG